MVDNERSKVAPLLRLCEHLLQPSGKIVGSEVGRAILPSFESFCSAIPTDDDTYTNANALASIDGRSPVSHKRIRDFIVDELGPTLYRNGIGRGDRVALFLPNGPELALAILGIANWATCVPMNANGAKSELENDLRACGADVIIGLVDGGYSEEQMTVKVANFDFSVLPSSSMTGSVDFNSFAHIQASANLLGIPFIGLVPSNSEAGIFRLLPLSSGPESFSLQEEKKDSSAEDLTRFNPNTHNDEVLVLFTSGTTGNKKVVPHCLGDMLIAAATIALSWKLTPSDVNCNLMPLFHVGGIVRQVFSPILSGGCVICCPSFDPSIFWALLEKKCFTWYYAAPTMHQLILQTGEDSGVKDPRLRMIANAAGGLLPSLAMKLRDVFKANVLPSYGMTECMPISSPPATYELEKPGTSGVPVGPEVAILNLMTLQSLPPGTEGPICVRGEPCFRGYGVNYSDPKACPPTTLLEGGWFNTGDLGYLDEDGYLYITGRSKEVINRGGEIISPMEVEEAVLSHPRVQACAAFSAPHNVLQEVVGIVIIPVADAPRVDLQELHEYLGEDRLTAAKWPQCLVFMDALPKSHTNKLLRVKLGHRLGIPELNDSLPLIERTFEAHCPPQGASLDVAITCHRMSVDAKVVGDQLHDALVEDLDQYLFTATHPHRVGTLVAYVYNLDRSKVVEVALKVLDRYAVPSHVCVLSSPPGDTSKLPLPQASDSVAAILNGVDESADPLVQEVQHVFEGLLSLDYAPSPSANFFNLGGSSMLASQLASKIRKSHRIPFSGAEVFHHTTCDAIASLIRDRIEGRSNACPGEGKASSLANGYDAEAAARIYDMDMENQGEPLLDSHKLAPQNSLLKRLFQLFPLLVVFPVWQVSRFFLFFSFLLYMLDTVPGVKNIGSFVLTVLTFHLMWVTLTPLLFVAIKWIVIGRYKEGRYAIWSSYYLRWWFVDMCRKIFGRGVWGSNEVTLNFFYRLLGAKIGHGTRISIEAEIAEYDLVTIGKGAAIEYANVRPFGVDLGCIILGPVSIGARASIGARSVVAPFTAVPDNTHLCPLTSSYEVENNSDPRHAHYNRRTLPEPSLMMQTLVGRPITFLVDALSHVPALLVVIWMVSCAWQNDGSFHSISGLMEWLCDVHRIPFYIGIRIVRATVAPLVYMAGAILVKWFVIGQFEAGPRDTTSQWELLRHWLALKLFSRENIQNVTELLGRHYELVSVLYRMLGAKVGKRVFWPGHQPITTGEFDLLEIGDDVVFGSRSALFFTTTDSCEHITLCAGSNVSDNSVVLPGSIVGKNAVLASNSLCPEGWYLPEGSVWLGCHGGEPIMLEKGVEADLGSHMLASEVRTKQLVMEGDSTTISPFGKAFYHGQATYRVLPLSFIIAFTFFTKVFVAIVHSFPLLASLHGAACILYGLPISERDYKAYFYTPHVVFLALLFVFFLAHLIRVGMWLAMEVGAKWTFMGRRQEGRYNYDTSDYAQRWELYQILGKVRKVGRLNLMDFISGTPYMSTFFRLLGGEIGNDCCLYPAGGDPYMPEPDLVKMGDRCVVDCASIVCHLNTRGNFELKKIVMEDNTTLRTRARLQQGVHMERGSMLLEKSLAMTGEVIEADSVWQGSPASAVTPLPLSNGYGTF